VLFTKKHKPVAFFAAIVVLFLFVAIYLFSNYPDDKDTSSRRRNRNPTQDTKVISQKDKKQQKNNAKLNLKDVNKPEQTKAVEITLQNGNRVRTALGKLKDLNRNVRKGYNRSCWIIGK